MGDGGLAAGAALYLWANERKSLKRFTRKTLRK